MDHRLAGGSHTRIPIHRSVRKRLSHLVVVIFLTAAGSITFIGHAAAYSIFGWWSRTDPPYNYCSRSGVSGHTNWDNLIDASVAQYNALHSAGYTNPSWSRVLSCTSKVIFDVGSIRSTLCGLTSWSPANGQHLTSAIIDYSNTKTFWDGTQNGKDCNFRWTSLHEFGHSQGLGHSCTASAVMVGSDNKVTTLQADDKAGVRWIYDATFFGPPIPDNPACN